MSDADFYRSRTGADEVIVARRDPVLWGDGSGLLDATALRAFARDGFVVLEGLLADELDALRAEAERIRDGLGAANEEAPAAESAQWPGEEIIAEPESRAIRSVFRVHRRSDVFRRLAAAPKLAGVARQILASDVYVHQSRINFKPGFDGREFQWHSDFETWHVEDGMPRMRAVSASILLTDNLTVNGPLMIIAGSHERYVRCAERTPSDHYRVSLKKQIYGTPSPAALRALAERGRIEATIGRAGTVVFFDCNAMHGSAGNISPYPRNNVFLVFNSVENRLREPFGGLPPRPDFLGERDAPPMAPC